MKIFLQYIFLSLAFLPFTLTAQFASFSAEIFEEGANVFYEDIAVTADNGAVGIFTAERENGRAMIMIKWNKDGFPEWQKEVTHQSLELYPELIKVYPDGRLAVGVEDFEFQGGFSQSNISWLEFSADGELLNALRIGNTDAQIIQDATVLDNEEVILTIHYGTNGFWGTGFLKLNTAIQTIPQKSYMKEGDLTYINRLFPMSNNRYMGVGTNTTVFGEPRQAQAVILDGNLQPINGLQLTDIVSFSEATYAVELANGNFFLYVEKDELRAYFLLDENLNVIEVKQGGFGEIKEIEIRPEGTFFFSGSSGALEFISPSGSYGKVIASEKTAAIDLRFSNDMDLIWGAGNYLDSTSELFRAMVKSEIIEPEQYCGSYSTTVGGYVDAELDAFNIIPTSTNFDYQIIEDTDQYIVDDFKGEIVQDCQEIIKSTNDVNTLGFDFSPNPVQHTISIDFRERYEGKLNILDLQGKVLSTYNVNDIETSIDVSTLPKGMYLLRAGNTVSKFVKN